MTYYDLMMSANRKLDNGDITLGEYEEMIEPLKREIEPERKKGKWIEKEGYDGDVYYDCSVCGNSWTTIDGTPWDNGMNYCPNCGAEMEVEDAEKPEM